MRVFDSGQLVRVYGEFVDITTSQFVDPATVRCIYRNPNNLTTTLVHGVDNALIKDATGRYHVDLNANIAGNWFYRWESTGANQGAYEGNFSVTASQI